MKKIKFFESTYSILLFSIMSIAIIMNTEYILLATIVFVGIDFLFKITMHFLKMKLINQGKAVPIDKNKDFHFPLFIHVILFVLGAFLVYKRIYIANLFFINSYMVLSSYLFRSSLGDFYFSNEGIMTPSIFIKNRTWKQIKNFRFLQESVQFDIRNKTHTIEIDEHKRKALFKIVDNLKYL